MEYNKYIDHTNLKPDATKEDILMLCAEANKYKFKSVCVNPYYVSLAHELLNGSGVMVCTVIGFPLGGNTTDVKAFEVTKAIQDGADEVDMVINISAAKNHDWDYVYNDIKACVEKASGTLLKVIIETCLLTDEEKVEACKAAVKAQADYVKTSTGFSTSGANEYDVKLMVEAVKGSPLKVKASGGIRDKDTFLKLIDAGASRIGCSKSCEIMEALLNE
jgi:deoxyribose-phosphate aldolase